MVIFFKNKSHPCLKNLLNLLYFNLCVCIEWLVTAYWLRDTAYICFKAVTSPACTHTAYSSCASYSHQCFGGFSFSLSIWKICLVDFLSVSRGFFVRIWRIFCPCLADFLTVSGGVFFGFQQSLFYSSFFCQSILDGHAFTTILYCRQQNCY